MRARHAGRRKRLAIAWGLFLIVLYAASGEALFDQPYFGVTLQGDRIVSLDADGPGERAGIPVGARIVGVNDQPIDALVPFLNDYFYSGALGRTPRLDLITPDGPLPISVDATAIHAHERLSRLARLVTGIGFLLIGLYAALHIEGRLTLLFFAFCSAFSLVLLPIAPESPPVAPLVFALCRSLGALLLAPVILHFFLLFPRLSGVVRAHPPVLRWLYVPALIALPVVAYVFTARLWHPPGVVLATMAVNVLAGLSLVVYAALALVSFVVGYVGVRSRAERRRYTVVLVGTLVGVAPLLLGTAVHLVWPNSWSTYVNVAVVGLLVMPASFAYAIVRHRVLDIEIVVKRSAAFSLLTACLFLITSGVYIVFGRVLENATGERNRWIMVLSLVTVAAVFTPLRHRIERLVDRTLFRDRYDERRMLRELGRELPSILDLGGLLSSVVDKLSRTLRVREAAIFLRPDDASQRGGEFRMAYASGLPLEDLDLPPLPARLLDTVTTASRPLRSTDIEESLPFGELGDAEERILNVFHGGVLVPLGRRREMLAVLALGRRRGGESYGLEDLELLQSIAGQAEVGMRNAISHARRVDEERIARELAVARDIQQKLLPDRDPRLDRIEIAGGTRTCTEVGGDFYRYTELPGGRLGIAVGDVSGHGVPAALIMASVDATLRAESDRHDTPGELLACVNDRLCESIEPGQFVSLFCATIDPDTLATTFANAGHPPPLVVPPEGEVLEMSTGGLLLGIDRAASYRHETLQPEPGTVIVFYTDGLIETHHGDLEFGEDRVVALVQAHRDRSASELRTLIVDAAADFADGDAEDDVTLIVAKLS